MTWRNSLLVGIVILALAGGVSAQSSMGSTETVTGTVVSSSGGSLVLDTATGRQTFIVDTDSRLPSDLGAGSRVTVDFHRLTGGRMHAAAVTVLGTEPVGTTGTQPATAPATTTQPATAPATTATAATPMGPIQTVSGTVVSSGNGQLVLDTSKGQQTFIVDSDSDIASGVTVGSRAKVEFHRLGTGRLHAANVTLAAAAEPAIPATPMATGPASTSTREASSLPQTASDLPSIGLVGLVALVGGLALRVARHHTA